MTKTYTQAEVDQIMQQTERKTVEGVWQMVHVDLLILFEDYLRQLPDKQEELPTQTTDHE